MSSSVPFSVFLRLEAYGICRALRAVSRLSIFLFFMADFHEKGTEKTESSFFKTNIF